MNKKTISKLRKITLFMDEDLYDGIKRIAEMSGVPVETAASVIFAFTTKGLVLPKRRRRK